MVPTSRGGCCRCVGLHWRGLVVVVFLCVCGLDGCFSDSQGLIGLFGYHKRHHKAPVQDGDLCGCNIFSESLVVWGWLFGQQVRR